MNTNQNFSIFKTTQRERSSSTYCINPQRFLKGGSKFFLILLFTIMELQFSFAQDLDTTFGTNGILSTPSLSDLYCFDFDEYGNIIAAGTTIKGIGGYDLTITKTDENGNLITSFGNNGIVEVTEYYNSSPLGLKITDNNKILILTMCAEVQFQGWQYILMQFNDDGTRDTNFAPNGKIIINIGSPHFVNFENEFILVGHYPNSISKYNYNGVLYPNFGVGGTVVVQFVPYYAKSISDSSIIVAGGGNFGTGQGELAVCKLIANGDIDTSFATNGIWHLDIMQDFDLDTEYFNYVIEESNGEFVLSGQGFNFKLFFCKFLSNGVIDNSFGNNGFYSSDIIIGALPVLKNGNKYITGGYHKEIISINNNGTIDSTFGTAGYFSFASLNIVCHDMKLQGQNKIVLGGFIPNNGFALARLIIDTTTSLTYTISGTITDGNNPLANVTLSCPACLTQTETTDQNGEYSFSVTKGINAKIEPSLAGYIFDPSDTIINNIQQNITNVNFLAIDTTTLLPKTYTVSGNITMNGNPLANVLIDTTTALITAKSVLITDENGFYEINDIPENRSLTITPTLTGYKFDPPSYTFTATNNKTVNFIAEEELGIDNQQIHNITMYPNPVKDNLNFTEETQVEITDIQGRVLLRTTKAVKTVNISNLQAGIYFVKVTLSNQNVEMIKIVKP